MTNQKKRGRPKAAKEEKLDRRHVLNISPRMEAAVNQYRDSLGLARTTDAIRSLLSTDIRLLPK